MNVLESFDRWSDLLESKARTDDARLDAMLREVVEARSVVAELVGAVNAALEQDQAELPGWLTERLSAALARVDA